MEFKARLERLERSMKPANQDENCICFPSGEPPLLELRAEREAASAVQCTLHGRRFSKLAPTVYRVISRPPHLDRAQWNWHSPQYIKAMDASFPPNRWPAEQMVEPDGTVRFVLKDGTEIHRAAPPEEILDYQAPTDWKPPS